MWRPSRRNGLPALPHDTSRLQDMPAPALLEPGKLRLTLLLPQLTVVRIFQNILVRSSLSPVVTRVRSSPQARVKRLTFLLQQRYAVHLLQEVMRSGVYPEMRLDFSRSGYVESQTRGTHCNLFSTICFSAVCQGPAHSTSGGACAGRHRPGRQYRQVPPTIVNHFMHHTR